MKVRFSIRRLCFFGFVIFSILLSEAFAQPKAQFDKTLGAVLLSGLSDEQINWVLDHESLIRLQIAGKPNQRGMLVHVSREQDNILVKPIFSLNPAEYEFESPIGSTHFLKSRWTVEGNSNRPLLRLDHILPAEAGLPANALRLYLFFSESMARGQVRDKIHLYGPDNQRDEYAFLRLKSELWDTNQKRLTLLFDPGRVKQDVGPNQVIGTPLIPGGNYRIEVAAGMQSAAGGLSSKPFSIYFSTTEAERRRIDPDSWKIQFPRAKSMLPITIDFDRVIDTENAKRTIQIMGEDGRRLSGSVVTSATQWSFTPSIPWSLESYSMVIDHSFEDIAGNRINTAFDILNGSENPDPQKYIIHFSIMENESYRNGVK